MALFSNLGGDSSSSKNLVEFRAGKMNLKGTTVTPDKRKGQVYVHQSDDSLMHFCWKDRTSGVVEDDLIIFPDDTEFKRVPQCTTGRVYLLKFKSSRRKFFFWMQEPKTTKDDELCKKVNDSLNNPPTPGESGSGGLANLPPGLASIGDQLGDSNLQRLLGSVDQNQLLQLLGVSGAGSRGDDASSRASSRPLTSQSTTSNTGSSRPATQASTTTQAPATATTTAKPETTSATTTATTTTGSSKSDAKPVVQLSDLQSILANMQVPAGGQEQQSIDLSAAFTTDALAPLLSDPEVQKRLSPFLPEVKDLPQSEGDVKETIQSPQFKQALSVFSAALQSGQLAPLMQQFGLGQDAIEAASKGDILSFVKALQKSEDKSSKDEDMPLD